MTLSSTRRERPLFWLEIVATVLMGLAAIATSWSAYEAERWSGMQAAKYNETESLRIDSARASALANHVRAIDVGLFTVWLNAYAQQQNELAEFYRGRFRSEFVPAFQVWMATQPRGNPRAATSPFMLPEYRLADEDHAARLLTQAEDATNVAQAANEQSDRYVLNGVLFATVLFFCGIAQQAERLPVRAAIVGLALAMCAYGIVVLASSPIE
jgi:hypothetical protein